MFEAESHKNDGAYTALSRYRPLIPVGSLMFPSCPHLYECVGLGILYTASRRGVVPPSIAISNGLMRQAMKAAGLSTKKAVVEEGLWLLING